VIEKNAVALLSRAKLTSIFATAGLRPEIADVYDPTDTGDEYKLFAESFRTQLTKHENDITEAVDTARRLGGYWASPAKQVLDGYTIVDMMTRLVMNDESMPISVITPGTLLTRPDPLDIRTHVAEPVRVEQGGAQFEFRTLSSVSWKTNFVEIGSQMFDLNTWHLDDAARATLKQRAGW
jgi:hypothetical protein